MRMRWVIEDYEALARRLDGGNRWIKDKAALVPGELLLRLRRGLQVSQLQLAQRAGVPRSLVARAESGGDIQISSLKRLLKALECELVILPASQSLSTRFKIKAEEQRRNQKEWDQARRGLKA